MNSLKRRGQAYIVFDKVDSAVKGLAAMQSFPFCNKPMRIRFSSKKSDEISKREGTPIVPRVKKIKMKRKVTQEQAKLSDRNILTAYMN